MSKPGTNLVQYVVFFPVITVHCILLIILCLNKYLTSPEQITPWFQFGAVFYSIYLFIYFIYLKHFWLLSNYRHNNVKQYN